MAEKIPQRKRRSPAGRSVYMKAVCKTLLFIVIAAGAVFSVYHAIKLYRSKYAPRYLKGNAC